MDDTLGWTAIKRFPVDVVPLICTSICVFSLFGMDQTGTTHSWSGVWRLWNKTSEVWGLIVAVCKALSELVQQAKIKNPHSGMGLSRGIISL